MKKRWHISMILSQILAFVEIVSAGETTELRIAIKQFPPFVFKDELKGFCIDLADIIRAKHNIALIYIRYESVSQVLSTVGNRANVISLFRGSRLQPSVKKKLISPNRFSIPAG